MMKLNLRNRLRQRLMMWLLPGVMAEVSRMKYFKEAMHDLHMVPVPYTEATLETAFQNAVHFEQEVLTRDGKLGPDFIKGRQRSLMEICKKSGQV